MQGKAKIGQALISKAVRLGLTCALLLALSLLVDWRAVLHLLPTLRPEWLVAAAACIVAARLLITWRWANLLTVTGQRARFGRLFLIVSAGIALGSLLPSSLGPDIARGVLLRTRSGSDQTTTGVVASLTLDRYSATLGTLLVAVLGALLVGYPLIASVLLSTLLAIAVVTILLMRTAGPVLRILTPGPLRRLRPKLEALVGILRTPGMLRRGLVPAVLISAGMTLCRVGMIVCLYAAFGFDVPVDLALFTVPMMLIALMVPVTIGGFGVREWLLVIGFEAADIPADVSVSVGLLSFVLQLLISLPAIVQIMMLKRQTDGSTDPT